MGGLRFDCAGAGAWEHLAWDHLVCDHLVCDHLAKL